jgi:hypothetical protein
MVVLYSDSHVKWMNRVGLRQGCCKAASETRCQERDTVAREKQDLVLLQDRADPVLSHPP